MFYFKATQFQPCSLPACIHGIKCAVYDTADLHLDSLNIQNAPLMIALMHLILY